MELVEVRTGTKFSIWCESGSDDQPPFLQFMNTLESDDPTAFNTLARRLKNFTDTGRYGNSEVCHDICKNPKIYQWTAGSARVLWFYEPGRCVIVSHGFIKKQGKTPPLHKSRATEFFSRYQRAKEDGELRKNGEQ